MNKHDFSLFLKFCFTLLCVIATTPFFPILLANLLKRVVYSCCHQFLSHFLFSLLQALTLTTPLHPTAYLYIVNYSSNPHLITLFSNI